MTNVLTHSKIKDMGAILDVGADRILHKKLANRMQLEGDLRLDGLVSFLHVYLVNMQIVLLIGAEGAGKSTLVASLGFTSIDTDDFLLDTRKWRKAVADERETCDFTTMLDYTYRALTSTSHESMNFPQYDNSTGLALAAPQPYKRVVTGRVNNLIISGCLNPFTGEQWQTKSARPVHKPDLSIYLFASDSDRYAARRQRDIVQKQRDISEQALLDQFNQRQKSQLEALILPELETADLVIVVSVASGEHLYSVYEQN